MTRVVSRQEALVLKLPGRSAKEIASAALGAASSTMRRVVIEPGATNRGPHVHYRFEEIIHVLEGSGRLVTATEEFYLGAGDTAIVAAGEVHLMENSGDVPLHLLCTFPVPDIRPGTCEFESWQDAKRSVSSSA